MGSISDNKAEPLHIARTPDALVVTLPGSGYRLAELIDTTGRLVWCEYLDGEPGEVTVPTTALASGVYVVALTDNRGKRTVQKLGW
ncbi:T9SS type A sorting domain-containing protein [Barnesiella sp. An55]|uniref:T9SS type A sorting domain-containing protein n=1 Tax=Barnesiella sp. An55 TaxID=1965646 RepID=UPI001177E415|nr:T9SS type A sorting domain-containing protein [Barnesiella sp. An55]HIZ27263.1 T9SS type A sorting domain-containing protein [Candidatus Barnesiella merdipullorum]